MALIRLCRPLLIVLLQKGTRAYPRWSLTRRRPPPWLPTLALTEEENLDAHPSFTTILISSLSHQQKRRFRVRTELLLFLLGTSIWATNAEPLKYEVPTEIIIAKNKHDADEIISPLGQSPFISNFIQKGTNVFFKPQVLLSPRIVQQPTLVDCNTPPLVPALSMPTVPEQIVLDEPLRIVETTLPGSNLPVPHVEEIIDIKPASIYHKPMGPIYDPPVLPPLPPSLPEIPVLPPLPLPLPEIPVLPPLPPSLPEIPVLPPLPLPLPEIPIVVPDYNVIDNCVDIPASPILPIIKPEVNFVLEQVIPESSSVSEIDLSELNVMHEHNSVLIPEAPILPPLSPIPELPAPVIMEEPIQVPCILEVSQSSLENDDLSKLPNIPVAPELPPLTLPELPVPVSVLNPILPATVVVEASESNEITHTSPNYFNDVNFPTNIPPAPVLPPYAPINVPAIIEETLHISQGSELSASQPVVEIHEYIKPSVIPDTPLSSINCLPELPLPAFNDETSLIIQENVENIKPVEIPAAPLLPPLAPHTIPYIVNEPVEVAIPSFLPEHMPILVPELPHIAVPTLSKESSLSSTVLSTKENILSFLSGLFTPHLPSIDDKIVIPSVPKTELISFPTTCIQNIILKRVLPNILNEHNLKVEGNVPIISAPSPYIPIQPVGLPLF
ncbi:titin-like [Achroia grisella]|uniref:titin-like n=1 Tax=Achroia grisella TaxID=688607 RepID=UPI0027D2004D|nr:titin-like [Achroia grisella]